MKVSRRANNDRYYCLQTRWFGVYVHRIHHSEGPTFHTHPWSWVSIVFGSYDDERLVRSGTDGWLVTSRTRRVFGWNRCRAGVAHRVTLPRGPVWTICFRVPRRCQWQVLSPDGDVIEVEPWTGLENPSRTEYATPSTPTT